MSLSSIPLFESIRELVPRYDVWLCDIWGVIHNGRHAFPEAVEACRQFIVTGGTVILISNAPRPAKSVEQQFDRFGIGKDAYNAIVTSGDVTRSLIRQYASKPLFHLGPKRDLPVFDGIDVDFVEAEESQVLVCTGLYDDVTETPDDYREILQAFHDRNVPMICANPDLMVERGTELVYCAGALAQSYQALGGEVLYAGKPHLPIYDLALLKAGEERGQPVKRDKVLCIGDGLKTDMAGAEGAGYDALFVASGLHVTRHKDDAEASGAEITKLFEKSEFKPIGAQLRLQW